MKKRHAYIDKLFFVGIIVCLIATAITKSIGGLKYYVPALFAIEFALLIIGISKKGIKLSLSSKERNYLIFFVTSQLIAYVVTSIEYSVTLFDIHKVVLYVGMVYACYYRAKKENVGANEFEFIINVLIVIGLFSCLYNYIENVSYFRMGSLSTIMHYTWNFSSFYFTRATYGTFVSFSSMAALVKSEKKHSKWYFLLYLFFTANVVITGARAQIVSILVGSILYLAHSKAYRRYIITGSIVLVIVLIFLGTSYINSATRTFIDRYYLYFDHSQGGATDLSTGRLYLWKTAFDNTDLISFFIGHGLGSKDTIMTLLDVRVLGVLVTSFHNGYIDLFFETGIAGIAFVFLVIKTTIANMKKNMKKDERHFFYGVLSIVLIANIFDSNNLLFTTDVFSTVASIIAIAIPNSICHSFAAYNRKIAKGKVIN